jgi:hypothetical protein
MPLFAKILCGKMRLSRRVLASKPAFRKTSAAVNVSDGIPSRGPDTAARKSLPSAISLDTF